MTQPNSSHNDSNGTEPIIERFGVRWVPEAAAERLRETLRTIASQTDEEWTADLARRALDG